MNYRLPGQSAVMDNQSNSGSPVARAIPVIIFFVGLLGVYYLYQYLFGPKTANQYVLLSEEKAADVAADKAITISSDKLPALYDGGEFTVSTWFYVSNWNHKAKKYKSIFRLGGPEFDTLRIYLGGMKPKLHVRVHTHEPTAASTTTTNPGEINLENRANQSFFTQDQNESALLNEKTPMCDLPEVDLQRWVNVTVAVNGRTTDIYLDGKLVRSCVLPSFYKVDAGGYSAYLLSYGGFGGYLSTTTMYDAALNPDAIYRNYIAGPQAITSIGDWIRSMFKFNVNVTVDTK